MAKFAIVAPPIILEQLERMDALGPTHLLLAHDVVTPENRERYYTLFHPAGREATGRRPLTKDRNGLTRERTIIMDNSVIELGTSVSPEVLKDACDLTEATCVVLPDVLKNGPATRSKCLEALNTWHPHKLPPYMMVPQGKTIEEFMYCAEVFANNTAIKYWGIPRNLVELHGSRQYAIQELSTLTPGRPIHLMGFSDNLADDVHCAKHPSVISIDSAVPLRLTTHLTLNSHILQNSPLHEPRRDWWQKATWNSMIPKNLSYVRGLVRGP